MARKQNRLLSDLASGAILAAKSQDCIPGIMDDLSLFSDVLATPGVLNALDNAAVPLEKRIETLKQILEGKIEPLTMKSLILLIDYRLLGSFESFYQKAESAARENANYHLCRATSAEPLNEKDRKRLTDILEKKFSGKVSVRYTVNPEVIGGLSVTCGDWRYLGTVQAKLQQLSRHLITA